MNLIVTPVLFESFLALCVEKSEFHLGLAFPVQIVRKMYSKFLSSRPENLSFVSLMAIWFPQKHILAFDVL